MNRICRITHEQVGYDPTMAPDAECIDCGSPEVSDEDQTRCDQCLIEYKATWGEALADSQEDR